MQTNEPAWKLEFKKELNNLMANIIKSLNKSLSKLPEKPKFYCTDKFPQSLYLTAVLAGIPNLEFTFSISLNPKDINPGFYLSLHYQKVGEKPYSDQHFIEVSKNGYLVARALEQATNQGIVTVYQTIKRAGIKVS